VRLVTARKVPLRFQLAACAASALPDADAILHHLGVPYAHPLGHRGFWHSLAFAALVAGVLTLWLFREGRGKTFLFLFVVGATHGVLDAMTNGGLGVAFFAPFDNTRYFLPWRPLVVGPIGIAPFFSAWGLRVLASEIVWVWIPLAGLLAVVETVRRRRAPRPAAGGP
jgi:inner membrane protein